MNRVVITGVGVVSPIGNDMDTFWSNVKAKTWNRFHSEI